MTSVSILESDQKKWTTGNCGQPQMSDQFLVRKSIPYHCGNLTSGNQCKVWILPVLSLMITTWKVYRLLDRLIIPCLSLVSRHLLTSPCKCCGIVLWGKYTGLPVIVGVVWASLSQNPKSSLWSEKTSLWSHPKFRSQSCCSLLNRASP